MSMSGCFIEGQRKVVVFFVVPCLRPGSVIVGHRKDIVSFKISCLCQGCVMVTETGIVNFDIPCLSPGRVLVGYRLAIGSFLIPCLVTQRGRYSSFYSSLFCPCHGMFTKRDDWLRHFVPMSRRCHVRDGYVRAVSREVIFEGCLIILFHVYVWRKAKVKVVILRTSRY